MIVKCNATHLAQRFSIKMQKHGDVDVPNERDKHYILFPHYDNTFIRKSDNRYHTNAFDYHYYGHNHQ